MSRLKQLEDFLNNNPGDSFIRFAIAKEHEKSGNTQEALDYYLLIEKEDEAYVGLYYHLGKLYESQEQLEKAFLSYKKGMQIARQANDQHAYNELAAAKLNLGDDEDFE